MFRDHGLKSFVDDTNNPTSESMLWSQVRTKVLDKGVVYCFMLKFYSTLMGGQKETITLRDFFQLIQMFIQSYAY